MTGILFVCTGNMYRSPLAAAFFQARLVSSGNDGWLVDSAGTWTQPGLNMPLDTIRAAGKFGANIEGRLTQLISADLLSRFDIVIVMEKGHKEALDLEFPSSSGKTHLLSRLADELDYDVMDPMQSRQDVNILASDLFNMVERAYPAICRLAQGMESSPPALQ